MVIENSLHLSDDVAFLKRTSHIVYIQYVYSCIECFTQYSEKHWHIKNSEIIHEKLQLNKVIIMKI